MRVMPGGGEEQEEISLSYPRLGEGQSGGLGPGGCRIGGFALSNTYPGGHLNPPNFMPEPAFNPKAQDQQTFASQPGDSGCDTVITLIAAIVYMISLSD
jgi:hypothetical protein